MKIWLVSKYASAPHFGYPTRQYFLAKKFSEIPGYEVSLISSRSLGFTTSPDFSFYKNSLRYSDENLQGVVLNGPKIKGGFSLLRIYSWIIFELRFLWWAFCNRKNKPDAIIVSSLSLFTFLSGVILKFIFNAKLIIEVRDIWPLTLLHMKGWNKKNLFIRTLSFVEKLGYKQADLIIGTMPNFRAHVNNVLSSAANKVQHIPIGFDKSFFLKNEGFEYFENYFRKINPQQHFVVAYVGTIGLVNKVDEIIQAAQILQQHPITFVILGKGPEKEKLVKIVEDQNLLNVFFHDSVSRNMVQAFLKHCDLALNPIPAKNPVYQFGVSPNKWIDYMYSEKPLLVSFDGYKNIIDEAQCGKFIEPGNIKELANAIEWFANLPLDEREKMGKNGKAYLFTHLSYDILASRYLYLISQIDKN